MGDDKDDKLTDIAMTHASINGALTKAILRTNNGEQIPWEELEAAIKIAVANGVATAADLKAVQNKEINIARWREILAAAKAKYGNAPRKPGPL